MTRLATGVALAAFGVALVGCGPAKQLPDAADLPTAPGTGEKAPAVPTQSEAAAREYVETVRKAFGGGNADLVAKSALSRATLKGMMVDPESAAQASAKRTIAAGWPDRFFGGNEIDVGGGQSRIRVWVRGDALSIYQGDREQDRVNVAEYLKIVRADAVGQHWMALLLPLADPKAVVYDLKSADVVLPHTSQSRPMKLLKLVLPERPTYQLTFDAKTDLLVRVEYTTVELGGQMRKQWTVVEHKSGPDGRMLPTKTECRHKGALVEKWDVEKWEFPASIDADFDTKK